MCSDVIEVVFLFILTLRAQVAEPILDFISFPEAFVLESLFGLFRNSVELEGALQTMRR